MPLEQQVVSLELAQQLKSLGVKQESYFQHYLRYKGQDIEHWVIGIPFDYEDRSDDVVSAFTCSELGEMLPKEITVSGGTFAQLNCRRDGNGYWYISYREQATMRMIADIGADTEADARAKMLVYLLENKLITL